MKAEAAYRYGKYAINVALPGRATAAIVENHSLSPETQWAREVMASVRYRITALSFLTGNNNLDDDEKLGVVLFIGLINSADDLVDNNPHFLSCTTTEELDYALLTQPLVIDNKRMISNNGAPTLADLKSATLKKFSPAKQKIIESFRQQALVAEHAFKVRQPGFYSFEEAMNYRDQTTNGYAEAALRLSNLTDPIDMNEFILLCRTYQLLDDLLDWREDYQKGTINPFIALAFEQGEESQMQNFLQVETKGKVGRIVELRRLLRQMPQTRRQYKKIVDKYMKIIADRPSTPMLRLLCKIIGI